MGGEEMITFENIMQYYGEILTFQECDALQKQLKNGFFFSSRQLKLFLSQYAKAKKENDLKTAAKIIWKLENGNFHSFCSKMVHGDYDGAQAEIQEDYE